MEECVSLKKVDGALKGQWVGHDTRDEIVDYVRRWSDRAELPAKQLVRWIGVGMSKYYEWTKRYGKVNDINRSCRGTTGWKPGSGKPSCRSTPTIRWKVIGG